MENLWIFYSLGWLIALWLWDFIKKLILSRWVNKEVFLLLCFVLYVPVFWINMYFQWTGILDNETLKSGIILWVNNFFAPLWVLISLKYLDTSFALIFIRLVSSFVILFIWIYLLWDSLSLFNIIWFLIWAIAIFMLSGFQFWKKLQMHRKWVIALWITTLAVIFGNTYFKYIVADINVADFMPIQFTTTLLCIFAYMLLRWKLKYINKIEIQKSLPYASITMIIFVIYFLYFLPNIYLLGPLSLWYKMLSYGLIVPILLSIIFLWDKVDTKRAIAFILTIISIFLFLI